MPKKIQQAEIKTEFSSNLKDHLLKSLEVDPKFSEAHFQLALLYQEDGDYNSAENHYLKAIESGNKQTLKIDTLGEKLLKKLQFQNAKVQFMKAQKNKHHCARVNFQLSILYSNQNKLAKAQTCLQNSIELNSSFANAHRDLGILLLDKKNYDDARPCIENALDLDYGDYLSHSYLGIIMKHSKDYEEAELHFLTALDINPTFVVCLLEMAHLQLVMKNQMKAKKYYQKAREISPNIKHTELDRILG